MRHAFGRLIAVQAFYCHWDCYRRAKLLGLTEASRREREPRDTGRESEIILDSRGRAGLPSKGS